jgi:hypothetical protein
MLEARCNIRQFANKWLLKKLALPLAGLIFCNLRCFHFSCWVIMFMDDRMRGPLVVYHLLAGDGFLLVTFSCRYFGPPAWTCFPVK